MNLLEPKCERSGIASAALCAGARRARVRAELERMSRWIRRRVSRRGWMQRGASAGTAAARWRGAGATGPPGTARADVARETAAGYSLRCPNVAARAGVSP